MGLPLFDHDLSFVIVLSAFSFKTDTGFPDLKFAVWLSVGQSAHHQNQAPLTEKSRKNGLKLGKHLSTSSTMEAVKLRVLLLPLFAVISVVPLCQGYESYSPNDDKSGFQRRYRPIPLKQWLWKCQDDRCVRYPKTNLEPLPDEAIENFYYLEACKSVCGDYGALWPMPTGEVKLSKQLNSFLLKGSYFTFDAKIVSI